MDTTRINHNNSGHKYRIAVDIAKEGSHIWDLTPYFKGRVGDNNFGLQVTWYYQGQLMNVVGMKPYIEGLVGQYSFGQNGEIDMDPDAVPVRYDGSPDDCEEAGKATFYFPSQMFPKEGIFKGFIGVKDDRDGSKNPQISGVTIWFKVLPGIAQMGHACDAYVDELDKALQNFKDRLDNHDKDYQSRLQKVIDDARNTYESETKNAHDSLDALKSQIQANRDEQQNLTQRLAGTEQQIATHDVVTRPEFLDLGNRLNQQVANLRQNKTLYFQNEAELKAKYPLGTDNLCVTLDTKHLWVYDYANGVWTDAGSTDIVAADPTTKDAIYYDSSNVAPDPDFKIIDGEWNIGCDLGAPNWAFESNTIDNSKVVQMHGYYNQATENNWNNTWFCSRNINISGQKELSVGLLINAKSAGQPSDAHTELQLAFFDKNDNVLARLTYNVPESQDEDLHLLKWEDLVPPNNAVKFDFAVMIHGSGIVRFAQPRINFSSVVLPYDIKDTINHVQSINTHTSSDNLVPNANLTNLDLWTIGADVGRIDYELLDQKLNTSNIVRIKGHTVNGPNDYGNEWLTSNDFKIVGAKAISISWMLRINLNDPTSDSVGLAIAFLDDQHQSLESDFIKTVQTNTDNFKLFIAENIPVPDNAVYANIYIKIHGLGYVDAAYPQANAGTFVLPYSKAKLLSVYDPVENNLVPNSKLIDLSRWGYGNDTNNAVVDELDDTFCGSHIARLYGHNKDNSNSTDNGNAWFTSSMFDIQGCSKIKASWMLRRGTDNKSTTLYMMCFSFFDNKNKHIIDSRSQAFGVEQSFKEFIANADVPNQAKYANVYIMICGEGYVDIAQPKVISVSQIQNSFVNGLINDGVVWGFGKDLGGSVPYRIESNLISFDGFHSDQTENNWNNTWLGLDQFHIQENSRFISLDLKIAINFLQENKDNYVRLEFYTKDQDSKTITSSFKYINFSEDCKNPYHEYWDGIWLPDEAETFQISIALHNKGTVDIYGLDYKFDDTYQKNSLPQLFVGNLEELNDKWQNAQFKFIDKTRVLDGYMQLCIQGDSSRSYPKKNFKTKFFKDNEYKKKLKWKPKSDWQANNKFNFKANWIDATHARNLVNAGMIEKATAITPMEKPDVTSDLLNSQGLGQMEGIPVEVYLADGYYGLFTLNTKKDDKTFGMNSDKQEHEAISVEMADSVFRDPNATIDEVHYLTEIHDKPSANLKSNFEKFVQFINNSSAEDFTNHLSDYIDVKSCINTMLYGILSKEYDYYSKSYLLCTWNDGSYFYMVPYDLDSTWGLFWNGSKIVADGNDPLFDFEGLLEDPNRDSYISNHGQNRLFERIYEHMKPQIKKQYDLLRQTVWKNADIVQAFKQFINAIPEAAYEKEQARWPEIPSKDLTDFEQIQQFVIERANKMDNFMTNNFYRETDPIENLQSQIDQLKNSGTTQK